MINKKIFDYLFGITIAIVIFNFYNFTKELSIGQYSDWLINYQGGFVRRGLIGEFLYQIHSILSIRLDILIFLTVSLLYIFFYKNFLTIIKTLKFHFLNLLIVFSPLSFFWPVMEEKASGRKDVLYLFLLTITALQIKKINFYKQKYLIILFSAIIVFSHTGFLFLLPFFLLVLVFSNKNKKFKIVLKEMLIIISSWLFFLIILINNTIIEQEQIELICNSVEKFVRKDCTTIGYISTLSWSLELNLELKKSLWMREYYNLFFSIAFFVSFLPLLTILYNSKFVKYKKINVVFFYVLFLLSTFPLYYLGVDYGRYFHLTYMSSIVVYAIALRNNVIIFLPKKKSLITNIKFKPKILVVIIFLYGFTFTVPHCCNNNFKFNYKNLVSKINEKLN